MSTVPACDPIQRAKLIRFLASLEKLGGSGRYHVIPADEGEGSGVFVELSVEAARLMPDVSRISRVSITEIVNWPVENLLRDSLDGKGGFIHDIINSRSPATRTDRAEVDRECAEAFERLNAEEAAAR